MPGSNFSIIDGADGVTKVPVSTPVNDSSGNTVVAHLTMTSVAGVATPISASNPEPVNVANFPTVQPVSGSVNVSNFPAAQSVSGIFWPATQPVSLAALPALATGSSTIGAVTQSGAWNVSVGGALPAGSNAIGSVSVSNLPATQAISAISLPLPPGAATSANQAAPGVAGSPSSAVLSVQGVAGGTPQQVAAANGVSLTATAVTLVAGASTQVIGANSARKSLAVFFLSGTATGYLTPGATATLANGIPLGVAPGGGVSLGQAYSWEGSGVPTGAINMLCAAAASVIVWEGQ